MHIPSDCISSDIQARGGTPHIKTVHLLFKVQMGGGTPHNPTDKSVLQVVKNVGGDTAHLLFKVQMWGEGDTAQSK